ncbi:putative F-box/kelch-repeat protein At1g15680 isoform X2 [Panicum virgatum]|uniref:putative F-box/kelch-repeat protein At1g15680 isoform X2 n=1 Tax=Panicum virgatum TaxID=38727 RepID=UPI0019D5F914|nr:putative F-box/kelch-repeat protein At1g15680 isoform X2 [Panicum virgatum]
MEVRSSSGKEPRAVRLPGDLVAEILARVPYRSLCRFKLVSRSWRALCSDPAVRRRNGDLLVGNWNMDVQADRVGVGQWHLSRQAEESHVIQHG